MSFTARQPGIYMSWEEIDVPPVRFMMLDRTRFSFREYPFVYKYVFLPRWQPSGYLTRKVYREAKQWCEEHAPPDLDNLLTPEYVWYATGDHILINDENLAFEFKLRWC